jgi:hypothetical protein
MVGKVRLAWDPKVNHSWNAPLYLSARGLTTHAFPCDGRIVEMEMDVLADRLEIRTSEEGRETVPFEPPIVSRFHDDLVAALGRLGIEPGIRPKPFDPSRVKSDIPFPEDTEPRAYDGESVRRFWRILTVIEPIFREFRGRFVGKCSPLHFFWHSFDLALTRFSGRRAPVQGDADPVTKDAYSHEVISAGFWAGDDQLPEPAFYCYVHPEPKGLAEEPLHPAKAWWQPQNETHMALLRYEDFRNADDPREALLAFLQSSYEAGAKRADWPRKELEIAP